MKRVQYVHNYIKGGPNQPFISKGRRKAIFSAVPAQTYFDGCRQAAELMCWFTAVMTLYIAD